MSSAGRSEATSYARAVERAWSALPGAPAILSPRDWRLVESWCARGIPLQVIQEAIEAAAERLRKSPREPRRPRGLSYIAPAVEEAWRVVLEGRQDASAPAVIEAAPHPPAPAEAWRRRMEAEPPGAPLAGLLDELLGRLSAGEDPAVIDRELDRRIEGCAGPALARDSRSRTAEQLAPYRSRMPAEAFETTLDRACAARLRQLLALPRLDAAED